YGLGIVLATQNPVDLDYKGLANAGTWFLGRLQTERDKARVLEGLESASAAAGARFDRARADSLLSNLPKRVFLMSNAHEDEPVLFQTRQTLSYLAGPLTREQIRRLTQPAANAEQTPAPPASDTAGARPAQRPAPDALAAAQPPAASASADAAADAASTQRPLVPAGVREGFLPAPAGARLRPALLGVASLHYVDAKAGVDVWQDVAWLAPLDGDDPAHPWDAARELAGGAPVLADAPPPDARFAPLPAVAARAPSYERWRKQLATRLHRARPLRLLACADPRLVSAPGADEGAFRLRLREALRDARDTDLERLRARFAPQLARLRVRIAAAEQRLAREQEQY